MEESQLHIPEGWESRELGTLYLEKRKSKFKVSDATNYGGIPFYTSGDAVLEHNEIQTDGENIFLATGGVANVKFYNGKVAYSTDTYVIVGKENIDTQFLYFKILDQLYYINTNFFQGSGLKHLQKKDFRKHFFALPKNEIEQTTIANILSKTDQAIAHTEALIAKYTRIKTGLMQDLLTKGIDEKGNIRSEQTHEFKDSPLGRIPKEWEWEKLSKISSISRGKFTPRPRNNPIYYNGDFPFIQTGDISNCKELYLNNFTQTLNEKGILVSKKFPAGTIVMTIAANIGDTAILGKEMYLTDSVVGIISSIDEIYFELFLRSIKKQLENLATQSAQKNINIQKLNEVLIKFPIDTNEQKRISNKYISIINAIKSFEVELSKLQSLKTGLMQDLLSGKVRVNNLMKEKQN